MQWISEHNHPPRTKVLVADLDSELPAMAAQSKQILLSEEFTSVVVLRGQAKLSQTFQRCRQNKGLQDKDIILNHTQDDGIAKAYGPDLGALQFFLSYYGFSYIFMAVKHKWATLPGYHADKGSFMEGGNDLPGATTVTMALNYSGTVMRESRPSEFGPGPYTKNNIQQWNGDPKSHCEEWAVPCGAFAIMKSRQWPEPHLPQVHRSPNIFFKPSLAPRICAIGMVASSQIDEPGL